MSFVQVMEFSTSKPDEMRALDAEWHRATAGRNKVQRSVLCEDRDHPGRYCILVFFDSYEEAMENSALPETDALSKEFAALTDGVSFRNLDVVDDK